MRRNLLKNSSPESTFLNIEKRLLRYASQTPLLDFKTFFSGDLEGWGLFLNVWGRPTQRFFIRFKAEWNGNECHLQEWFEFQDGSTLERSWHVSSVSPNRWFMTAADSIGTGYGAQKGCALHFQYQLKIPYRSRSVSLSFDDWMYAIGKDAVMNRTQIKKWGIPVAQMVLLIKKI